jgi:hypothetical protein
VGHGVGVAVGIGVGVAVVGHGVGVAVVGHGVGVAVGVGVGDGVGQRSLTQPAQSKKSLQHSGHTLQPASVQISTWELLAETTAAVTVRIHLSHMCGLLCSGLVCCLAFLGCAVCSRSEPKRSDVLPGHGQVERCAEV